MSAMKKRRGLSDTSLGLLAAALTLLLVVGVDTGLLGRLFSSSPSREVKAVFADARQLKPGDPVRISGVNVGTVDTVTLDRGRRDATVAMKLDGSAGPLYGDASAHIRFRTLLGGSFFVDIARGSSSAGALSSSPIPASRTDSQVEVDDITSVIDGRAKRGLQVMPGQLALALGDPRYPAQTLGTIAAQSPALAGGLAAVRGQQPSSDLRTLIDSANTTMQALEEPYGQLQQLVSGAASFLQATAARSADLQATIQNAPALLSQANTTMQGLRGTLVLANPLLVKLEPSAPAVAPTVADLRHTVVPADTLLNRAVPLLHALRPAVSSLASASTATLPLLNQLTPSIDELAAKILPYLNQVQPDSKHTFAQMIGPGAAALAAIGAYQDGNGRIVRFPATSGNAAFYLPCQTYFNNPAAKQLIACESISTAISQLFGSQAATGPGTASHR
jgi:phospholipid/cholesterol/gamma-HCH transport system substrate-binding protein